MEQTTPRETGDFDDMPKPLLLAAPFMHPTLMPSRAPAGIRCFNPGILSQKELAASPECFFTPPELPLPHQQAKAQLQDLLAYAAMHNKPGELSSLAASGAEKPFASDSLDFRKEFVDIEKISGKVLPPEALSDQEASREPDPQLIRSQVTLLLAWAQEERLMELGQLSQKLSRSWDSFDQALGLEGASDNSVIAELATDAYERSFTENKQAKAETMPWKMILEHMLRFVPSGAWLVFFDPELQALFEEAGIVFETAGPESLADAFRDGGMTGHIARLTPAELLGRKTSSDSSWLSRDIQVFFPIAE